ncbi:MAG: hypothetical protein RR691_04880, partial [Eubacterium sp.]
MEKESRDKVARVIFLVFTDVIVLFLSYFFAFILVYNFEFPYEVIRSVQFLLMAGIILKITVFFITGMYNTLWRYASIEELWQITFSVILANILAFVLYFIVETKVPTTVQILTVVFDLIMVGAIRIFYRTARRLKQGGISGQCHNVLIVGAGEAGVKILRELG